MKVTIDANILLNAVRDKLSDQQYEKLIDFELIAPCLIHSEIGNGLWKYVKFDDLAFKEAIKMHQYAISLVSVFFDDSELVNQSFLYVNKLEINFYDAIYLSLAYKNRAPLITFDKKLAKAAKTLDLLLDF